MHDSCWRPIPRLASVPALLVALGGTLASAQPGPPPAPWPTTDWTIVNHDLSGDCVADFQDTNFGLPLPPWGAWSVGDLDYDGDVDAVDATIYNSNLIPGATSSYTVHWSVWDTSGSLGLGSLRKMESDIVLPAGTAVRDTVFVNAGKTGNFPADGLHEMFDDGSGHYTDWEDNHTAWMEQHDIDGRGDLRLLVDRFDLDLQPSGLQGPVYVIWDLENWDTQWVGIEGSPYEQPWRDFVAEINSPSFDDDFIDTVGFNPLPLLPGQGWYNLSSARQTELLRKSWEYYAQDFYIATIDMTHDELENPSSGTAYTAKVGFWGLPHREFVTKNDPQNPGTSKSTYKDNNHQMNDEMDWLWSEVDVLTPSLYQHAWVQDPDDDCPLFCTCASYHPATNALEMKNNISAWLDITDRPGNATELLPFVAFKYGSAFDRAFAGATGDCINSGKDYLLPMNIDHQIRLPKLYGADGVMIWHAIKDADDRGKLTGKWGTQWTPILTSTTCP